ncbi:MAG: hypothetical protein ACXVLQ_18685, partial [Bacteriovorax sp.]
VFHSFNCMEIFLGSFVLLGLLSHKSKSKLFLATSILLLLNAFFYTFFMTPMIANISIHMHQIAATDPQYEVLRHQHAFYHNLYRYFDTTKLLVLLVLSGLMVRLTIKHKECA